MMTVVEEQRVACACNALSADFADQRWRVPLMHDDQIGAVCGAAHIQLVWLVGDDDYSGDELGRFSESRLAAIGDCVSSAPAVLRLIDNDRMTESKKFPRN